MRCDQFLGLSADALEFLQENKVPENVCAGCNRPFPEEGIIIGKFVGMHMDTYPLHRYYLIGEKYADEFLQTAPWYSGPCFFIGLQVFDRNGDVFKTFVWGEEDINKT